MKLIEKAKEAKLSSYSPYSNFRVGAALLTKSGKIYMGCNIENGAYSPSCCAERVAFYKAISEGEQEFEAIAVVGDNEPCYPCGVCRQVMREFCSDDFKIYMLENENKIEYTLKEILPYSFELER